MSEKARFGKFLLCFLIIIFSPFVVGDKIYHSFPYQEINYGLPGMIYPTAMTFIVYGSGNNTIYDLVVLDDFNSDLLFDSEYNWFYDSGIAGTGCHIDGDWLNGPEANQYYYYPDMTISGNITGLKFRINSLSGYTGSFPGGTEIGTCNETLNIGICELKAGYDFTNWTFLGGDLKFRCVNNVFVDLYNLSMIDYDDNDYVMLNISINDYFQTTAGKDYILEFKTDGDTGTQCQVSAHGFYGSTASIGYYTHCTDIDQDLDIDACSNTCGIDLQFNAFGHNIYLFDTVTVYPNGTANEHTPAYRNVWQTYGLNDNPKGIFFDYMSKYLITDSDGYIYVYDKLGDDTGAYADYRVKLDDSNSDPTGLWSDINAKKLYVLDYTDKKMYIYSYDSDFIINYLETSCDLDSRNTQPYDILGNPGYKYIFVLDGNGYIYTYSTNCNFIDRYGIYPSGNTNPRGIAPGFMGYDLITTIYISDYDDTGVYLYNYSLEDKVCLGQWINYIYYRIWDNNVIVFNEDIHCTMPDNSWCMEGYYIDKDHLVSHSPPEWAYGYNDTHMIFADILFSCDSECNLTARYCSYGCLNGQCLERTDPEASNIDILIGQLGQTGVIFKEGGESLFNLIFPTQQDKMLFGFGLMIVLAVIVSFMSFKMKVKDPGPMFQSLIVLELLLGVVFIVYQIFPWYIGFVYIVPVVWLVTRIASGGFGGK